MIFRKKIKIKYELNLKINDIFDKSLRIIKDHSELRQYVQNANEYKKFVQGGMFEYLYQSHFNIPEIYFENEIDNKN